MAVVAKTEKQADFMGKYGFQASLENGADLAL